MLIKKKLIQLPVPACPSGEKERNLANVQVIDEILNLNIFTPKKELKYRFFCDGKNGILYHADTKEWDTTKIREYYLGRDAKLSDADREIMRGFCEGIEDYRSTAEGVINGFFSYRNSEKRLAHEKRKYDRMKRNLQTIPAPPRDLGRFCDLLLFRRYSVIFPKGKGHTYIIRCLHCGEEREVEVPPTHKGSWRCPHCKSETIAYKRAYVRTIRDKEPVWLFRRTKGAETLEFLWVTRTYTAELKPKHYPDRVYVEYKTPEKTYRYKWSSFAYYADWVESIGEFGRKGHLYTWNLKALYPDGLQGLNLTRLKGTGKYNIQALLRNAATYRSARQLYKIGCFRLAEQTEFLKNPEKNTFEEVTGASANYKPLFRKHNYGMELVYKLSAISIHLNETQVKKLAETSITKEDIKRLLDYMTPQKLINYFYKQTQLEPDGSFCLADLYVDYIGMVRQLNRHLDQTISLDKSINRYPRNIRKAHDAISEELKSLLTREGDHILAALADKYRQQIPFAYQNLEVVYPGSTEDFVQEGSKLHHCVGSFSIYREKQMNEEWMTIFIRKRDRIQVPYYTATFYMKSGAIKLKECHGMHNTNATDTIKKFLEVYERWVTKKLKKEMEAA
ncbi:PcfJ domain-containing protein [Anaerovorax odorimutans]|uniref:PcfJ domain-containing protein n=1 Tax=Anaerovorax odorimutans TaxID=109327 RepID=A0ABT1RR85_9FIRM|nr:PcfJ domain-containing protein [Anaerovorax odorimutans]MCQ4637690.1 PcfJ domain-containing protein [Anaerovorax odorimutans]